MTMTTDNFTELKRLFDAEVERMRVKTTKIPAHLGGGRDGGLAEAAIFIKLLDGYSYSEAIVIFRKFMNRVDSLNRKTFKINAAEVEDVL